MDSEQSRGGSAHHLFQATTTHRIQWRSCRASTITESFCRVVRTTLYCQTLDSKTAGPSISIVSNGLAGEFRASSKYTQILLREKLFRSACPVLTRRPQWTTTERLSETPVFSRDRELCGRLRSVLWNLPSGHCFAVGGGDKKETDGSRRCG